MPRNVVNVDGTVVDTRTGLVWQRGDDGRKRTWQEALLYCQQLSTSGHNDWRLPTVRELLSLTQVFIFFDFPKRESYWSQTAVAGGDDSRAYSVNHATGEPASSSKTDRYFVRAVRGQACSDLLPEIPRLQVHATTADPELHPLEAALADPSASVRIEAIQKLSQSRSEGALDLLAAVLRSPRCDAESDEARLIGRSMALIAKRDGRSASQLLGLAEELAAQFDSGSSRKQNALRALSGYLRACA